jgi:hypothetical protein
MCTVWPTGLELRASGRRCDGCRKNILQKRFATRPFATTQQTPSTRPSPFKIWEQSETPLCQDQMAFLPQIEWRRCDCYGRSRDGHSNVDKEANHPRSCTEVTPMTNIEGNIFVYTTRDQKLSCSCQPTSIKNSRTPWPWKREMFTKRKIKSKFKFYT